MRALIVPMCLLSCITFGQDHLQCESPILLQSQGGVLSGGNPGLSQELQVKAGKFRIVGDKSIWENGVELIYRGYKMTGDRIEADSKREYFEITNGRIVGNTEVANGEFVTINFKTETFTFRGGRATIVPERTNGLTTGPFFSSAGSGSLESKHYHVENGNLTPCDQEHPHINFAVGSADIVPGKSLRMREVKFQVAGRTILNIPHLFIPLLNDRPRYLPEVGQSRDEGYYLKSRYVVPTRGEDYLDTRLDLMSRLGVGIGADYNYSSEAMAGAVGLYSVIGPGDTQIGKVQHRQEIGSGQLTLDANVNRNNYLTAPNTTIFNGRSQYSISNGSGLTNLGYTRNSSDVGQFSSLSESFSFSDSRVTQGGFRSDMSINQNRSSSKSGATTLAESDRVDVRFMSSQEMRSLRAELLYQRSIPVGGTTNFSRGSDITPLLTLRSDSGKIFGNSIGRSWPVTFASSFGQLQDPGLTEPVTRTTFEANARRSERLTTKTTLNWDGRFSQGVTSDDTAQYVIGYGANLAHQFGRNSDVRLDYRRLRQFGFSPLAIDRIGRNDAVNLNMNVGMGQGWTATASTGYDFRLGSTGQVPWQLVNVLTQYRSGNSRFQFGAVYDTFNQNWSTLRADSIFSIGETDIAAAVRFDGRRSVWSAASLQVEGFKTGRLSTDFLLSYNGFSRQFDAQQYVFTYDMHCTEAVLEFTDFKAGFRSGRQIAFYFRIKALPFGRDFGLGRQGQAIGGVGGFGR